MLNLCKFITAVVVVVRMIVAVAVVVQMIVVVKILVIVIVVVASLNTIIVFGCMRFGRKSPCHHLQNTFAST